VNRRGFTLAEAAITTAVVGMLAMMAAQSSRMMVRSQLRQQADVELHQTAMGLYRHFKIALERAGDGVANNAVDGRHIMADLSPADRSWILFFSNDSAQPGAVPGQMDPLDLWVRYRVQNGAVVEEVFNNTDRWDLIVGGLPGPVRVSGPRALPMASPNVRITRLEFSYYDANNNRVDDGFVASRVRVLIDLRRRAGGSDFSLRKEGWVSLKNVINARVVRI